MPNNTKAKGKDNKNVSGLASATTNVDKTAPYIAIPPAKEDIAPIPCN